MRILVTAGPTREYIDSVRFITNASSGKMGCAVAEAGVAAGHQVTLILAAGITAPESCQIVRFESVDDLAAALSGRFEDCDALVMAAAVGDFRVRDRAAGKLARGDKPVTVTLVPTEDVLAGAGNRKRSGQTVVAFAVEHGSRKQAEARARAKLAAKKADYIVVNTPEAISAESSQACILSADGVALSWAERSKRQLADEIVKLL